MDGVRRLMARVQIREQGVAGWDAVGSLAEAEKQVAQSNRLRAGRCCRQKRDVTSQGGPTCGNQPSPDPGRAD